MQISFDPKSIDLSEAAMLLGLILPAFVRACRNQGDTFEEVQEGMKLLIAGAWEAVDVQDSAGMP